MDKLEYISKFLALCEEGTEIVSEYTTAREKITLKCPRGHLRTTTANAIISKGTGRYCKECKGVTSSGRKTQDTIREEFKANKYTLIGEYTGALTKVLARNNSCGHEYEVVPSRVVRGQNIQCPTCTPSRRYSYTQEDFAKEILKFGLETLGIFKGMKVNVQVRSTVCGHEYSVNPGHLLYEGIGSFCKVCTGASSTKSRFFSSLIENDLIVESEYTTSQTPIDVRNTLCNHTYKVTPNNLVTSNTGIICRTCTPTSQVSKGEIEIFEFIKSIYNGWIIQSDRQILEGKELDIVLPDLGLAIEYNGAKWHETDLKPSSYHLNKTKAVEDFGYRLIHILDTEWIKSADIVKSRLRSVLGLTNRKVYGRNTTIREIPFPKDFLEKNHIQGSGSFTKYNYGAFLGEELIAVMTFTKARFTTKQKYELVRFCSILNTTVVGVASKLLKRFLQNHDRSIVSYADRRWSIGNLYAKLGFKYSHSSAPNYKYYKYKYSLNRYQCQKHLLKSMFPDIWSEEKSEHSIMKEAGYHKVEDCGNSVWVLE